MAQLFLYSVILFIVSAVVWWLYHWLFIITEGVFLGPRLVVWLYDREAYRYDDIKMYDMEDELILLVEPILGELSGAKEPVLLDVAVGTGRVPLFLFKDGRFTKDLNGRVVGVDASQAMLDLADKNLSEVTGRCELLLGSADAINFADRSFDAVSCLESLEFFPNPEKAIEEMIRVLKPGGSLLITRRAGWEARWFLSRHYDQKEFVALLEKKGLTDAVLYQWQNNYDLVIGRKPNVDEVV